MAELSDDPVRARRLAAAARERVETELAFANRVAKVERIYEQLMAEAGSPRA
jgi:hypothetical protein